MPQFDEGIYTCEITDQGLNKSSKKGTPGFFLRVLPEGSEYTRDVQWWITEGTAKFVARDLKSLGFKGRSWGELDTRREGFHNFVGATIKVACTHEENGDKVYERWGLPFGGADLKPLDKAEAQQLDSMFGAELQSQPDEYSEPARPAPASEPAWDRDAAQESAEQMAQEAANIADDDPSIPF